MTLDVHSHRPIRTAFVALVTAAVVGGAVSVPAAAGGHPGFDPIELVSLGLSGVEDPAAGSGTGVGVSAHGRYVVFSSSATDLVPGDTNGQWDTFVRDVVTGRTTRVSLGPGGVQGNGESRQGSISADGRYVAFNSFASNLVPGDTNDSPDVFLRDLKTGRTTLVSVGRGGPADLGAIDPAISADGKHVAFVSSATNLVVGDTNETQDVFVRDLAVPRTERVSLTSAGAQLDAPSSTPGISSDGRLVAFTSQARLVTVPPPPPVIDTLLYVRDRTAKTTREVSQGATADPRAFIVGTAFPSFSGNGRFIVFTVISSLGLDSVPNVWLRDLHTNQLQLISADSQGQPSTAVGAVGPNGVSADGRYVTFGTPGRLTSADQGNLSDVFRLDRRTGSLIWITKDQDQTDPFGGRIGSYGPAISTDGQHVAFDSDDKRLADGATAAYNTYLWNAARPS